MQVVEAFLWEQQRLRLPSFGQSNVPSNAIVDHPGAFCASRTPSCCVRCVPENHVWYIHSHDRMETSKAHAVVPRTLHANRVRPAGVYEDARHAYLHEVLVRRVGCAAALAVIEADVMQRLLAAGAVDFAVRIDCSDLGALPATEVGLRHDIAECCMS